MKGSCPGFASDAVTHSHRKYLFGLKFLITAQFGEVEAGTGIIKPTVKSRGSEDKDGSLLPCSQLALSSLTLRHPCLGNGTAHGRLEYVT